MGYHEIGLTQAIPIKKLIDGQTPLQGLGLVQSNSKRTFETEQFKSKPNLQVYSSLNLTIHYYCAKYSSNFIPRIRLTQRLS